MKISLWLEDAIAAAVFLALLVFGTPALLSLEPEPPMPPATAIADRFAHPIDYRAVVCQSGYAEPRKCRFYTESK